MIPQKISSVNIYFRFFGQGWCSKLNAEKVFQPFSALFFYPNGGRNGWKGWFRWGLWRWTTAGKLKWCGERTLPRSRLPQNWVSANAPFTRNWSGGGASERAATWNWIRTSGLCTAPSGARPCTRWTCETVDAARRGALNRRERTEYDQLWENNGDAGGTGWVFSFSPRGNRAVGRRISPDVLWFLRTVGVQNGDLPAQRGPSTVVAGDGR